MGRVIRFMARMSGSAALFNDVDKILALTHLKGSDKTGTLAVQSTVKKRL